MKLAPRLVSLPKLAGLAIFAAAAGLPSGALADQILQTFNDTLTAYEPTGSTPFNAVRPLAVQRGVGLDGSLRAPNGYGWSLAANPFGDVRPAVDRLGDMNVATGAYAPTAVDLALPGPGTMGVVIGRSFNGRQLTSGSAHQDSAGVQGTNWFQLCMPELVYFSNGGDHSKDVIYLVYGADRYAEFQRTGASADTYQGRNGAAGVLYHNDGNTLGGSDPDYYVYYDQSGNKTWFWGAANTGSAAWQFWKKTDPAGNAVYVGDASTASTALSNGYSSGKISQLFDAAGRRYCFTYTAVGGIDRLTQVLVETDAGGGWGSCGTETEVARVDYGYYTTTDSGKGLAGDLKLVTVTLPLTDSGINEVRRTYYRYYTSAWSNSDGLRGDPHQVKLVLAAEGCRKYDYDQNSALDYGSPEFFTASDSDLKSYSDAYLEYGNGDYKIASAFFSGECGCSGGTNGTYTFTYDSNGSYTDNAGYDTAWCTRATVLQPDGNYKVHYYDEVLQPLSEVLTHGSPGGYSKLWATQVIRNSDGQVTEVRTPAANDDSGGSGYVHSTGSFHAPFSAAGLIWTYGRVNGMGNDLNGLPESVKFKEGSGGTENFLSWTSYGQRDLGVGSVEVTRPVVTAKRSYYGSATAYNTANTYDETTMSYAWWSASSTDPLYITLKQVTTTNPVVTTAQNGSGAATSSVSYLRKDGTAAFSLAPDGIYTYTAFTSGQLTKRIEDVKTNGTFPSGDDPNTDWGITETGNGSDRTTLYTYDSSGRLVTTTASDLLVSQNYFSRLADYRKVTISWPRMTTGGGTTYFGPASYTVSNHTGKAEFQGTIAIGSSGLTDALTTWIDETDADPITALKKGTLASMRTSLYTPSGHQLSESRAYFTLPGSGAGSAGTNYDATLYGYDDMGRKSRMKDPTGTITRTAYDDAGRMYQTYLGTNDHSFSQPAGEAANADNMVKTVENVYDGGNGGGNSHLTMRTQFIQDNTTDRRDTSFAYDFRGRLKLTTPPQMPCSVTDYDNLGRQTAAAMYTSASGLTASSATSGTTNRCGLSSTSYDALGRVFETRRYQINQGTGAIVQVLSVDQYLPMQTWRDDAGRVIEVRGEQWTKTLHDRLGRVTDVAQLASSNDSAGNADALTLSGDIVLEEQLTTYESTDSDNAVMRATLRRHYDDLSTGTTGSLDSNGDANSFKYTMADLSGRSQIAAMWYDELHRLTDTVQYGTNGGSDFDRKPAGVFLTVPSRSATELRTTTSYNDDGTVHEVTDPRGKITRFLYDALFRQTAVIRNYVNGTPSSETGDDDVYTRYVYQNGLKIQEWVDFDGDNVVDTSAPKDQVTLYIYGTTKGTPSQSKIATGNLLRAIVYPDSSNAGTTDANIISDSSDVVSFAYNAQGQETYKKDQNGTVLETDYDTGGRVTHKRATTLGSGVDNWVRRISYTYLTRGLTDTITQWSSATVGSGSERDQIQYTYDNPGNIATFVQDTDSAIGASGRAAFTVSYTWELATSGVYSYRCTGMSYPGGSDLTYEYLSSSNRLDDKASRVSDLKIGSTVAAVYKYNGVGDVVHQELPEPNAFYRAYDPSNAHSYRDRDRFDRTTTSRWNSANASQDFYKVDLTYDENSNITSVKDNVLTGLDAKYTIDGLNRLTQDSQGTLSAGSITSRTRQEDWTLSQVGNWKNYKRDLTGGVSLNYSDAHEFQEDGTFNQANELITRELNTDNDNMTTGLTAPYDTTYSSIAYDGNGNLTNDQERYKYVYDAFNRLKKVNRASDDGPVAEYWYNGINYRNQELNDNNRDGDTDFSDFRYHLCYDASWRLLNTFRASDANPKDRYVYHNAGAGGRGSSSYIDDMVCRNTDSAAWTSAGSGSLSTRRYGCPDWRHDVSVILTDTGKMVEWLKYSANGESFAFPAGDTNNDGAYNATDDAAISSIGYDVRADANLDGGKGAADVTQAASITGGYYSMGRGYLGDSWTANRRGYAGYEHATELSGTKCQVRQYMYDAEVGRNCQRITKSTYHYTNLYRRGGIARTNFGPTSTDDRGYFTPESPNFSPTPDATSMMGTFSNQLTNSGSGRTECVDSCIENYVNGTYTSWAQVEACMAGCYKRYPPPGGNTANPCTSQPTQDTCISCCNTHEENWNKDCDADAQKEFERCINEPFIPSSQTHETHYQSCWDARTRQAKQCKGTIRGVPESGYWATWCIGQCRSIHPQ